MTENSLLIVHFLDLLLEAMGIVHSFNENPQFTSTVFAPSDLATVRRFIIVPRG